MKMNAALIVAALLAPANAHALDAPSVSTIAQMQALGAASAQRKTVRVQSYASASAGGGGDFSWVAGSCSADNGIWFAAKGVPAAKGCWHRNQASEAQWHSAWFGAISNDTKKDYTPQLRMCATKAAASAKTCVFDAGKYVGTVANYVLVPGTAYGSVMSAFPLSNNYRVTLAPGFNYKLAGGQAKIANDEKRAIGFFNTAGAVKNVSIKGAGGGRSVLDMNGQNNTIPGGTPWNQAFIEASGNRSRIDNLVVDGIRFQNAPGTNVIVDGQAVNGVKAPLGRKFSITNNQFIDGGLDTADHSAIYAYATDGMASNNAISNRIPYGSTKPVVGCNTAYEIHGSRQKFVSNQVKGCQRGVWVAGNATEPTQDSQVSDNKFETVISAVDLFRNSPGEREVQRVLITRNSATFNNDVPAGFPVSAQTKAFTNISTTLSVGDIVVSHNRVTANIGATIATYGFNVSPEGIPGGGYGRIEISNNVCVGVTVCVNAATNATNGIDELVVADNKVSLLSPSKGGGPTVTVGVRIAPTGAGIGTLRIEGNDITDDRKPPLTNYGVRLEGGHVNRLTFKAGHDRGATIAGFSNAATSKSLIMEK